MEISEITINGEVYTITKYDSGHIVKELKMTKAQKEQLAAGSKRDRATIQYKSMVRRRAKRLQAEGRFSESLILLKKIGE